MRLNIDGVEYYSARSMNAFDQLAMARKLGPALPLIEGLVSKENLEKDKTILVIMMLSNLPDDSVDFLVKKCLSVVMRKNGESKPAAVQTPDGHLLFDDIKIQALLDITAAVVEENLGDFFRTALSKL